MICARLLTNDLIERPGEQKGKRFLLLIARHGKRSASKILAQPQDFHRRRHYSVWFNVVDRQCRLEALDAARGAHGHSHRF
jgi:hypothetical protein